MILLHFQQLTVIFAYDYLVSTIADFFVCWNDRYGLPPLGPVPNGLTPLIDIWGKGKNRFPLLVLMNHPVTWVVTLPSIDANGEDGTIQAGEYAKGDTATLFVYQEDGHIDVRVWVISHQILCHEEPHISIL